MFLCFTGNSVIRNWIPGVQIPTTPQKEKRFTGMKIKKFVAWNLGGKLSQFPKKIPRHRQILLRNGKHFFIFYGLKNIFTDPHLPTFQLLWLYNKRRKRRVQFLVNKYRKPSHITLFPTLHRFSHLTTVLPPTFPLHHVVPSASLPISYVRPAVLFGFSFSIFVLRFN